MSGTSEDTDSEPDRIGPGTRFETLHANLQAIQARLSMIFRVLLLASFLLAALLATVIVLAIRVLTS